MAHTLVVKSSTVMLLDEFDLYAYQSMSQTWKLHVRLLPTDVATLE